MLHSSVSASDFGTYFSPAHHRSATPLSYISCLDLSYVTSTHHGPATLRSHISRVDLSRVSPTHHGPATLPAHAFSVRPARPPTAPFPSCIAIPTSGIVTGLADVNYLPEY